MMSVNVLKCECVYISVCIQVFKFAIISYLPMTLLEGDTGDDATLFLGPGFSVGVGATGISGCVSIHAAKFSFPAVTKFYNIRHRLVGACGEVIFTVAIIVSTQTTDLTLRGRNPTVVVNEISFNRTNP